MLVNTLIRYLFLHSYLLVVLYIHYTYNYGLLFCTSIGGWFKNVGFSSVLRRTSIGRWFKNVETRLIHSSVVSILLLRLTKPSRPRIGCDLYPLTPRARPQSRCFWWDRVVPDPAIGRDRNPPPRNLKFVIGVKSFLAGRGSAIFRK